MVVSNLELGASLPKGINVEDISLAELQRSELQRKSGRQKSGLRIHLMMIDTQGIDTQGKDGSFYGKFEGQGMVTALVPGR